MMLLSDSVGGADDRRNGFSNRRPVNVVASCAGIAPPLGNRDYIAESRMPRKLVGGLIQAAAPITDPSAPIDKVRKAAIDAHIPFIEEAGRRGVQVLGLQEVFNGP